MLHPENSGRQFEFWLNAAQEEVALLDKDGDQKVSWDEYQQSFGEFTDLPDNLPSLNSASFQQARKRKFDAHVRLILLYTMSSHSCSSLLLRTCTCHRTGTRMAFSRKPKCV